MLIALGCVTLLALALIATLGYLLRIQREERAQCAVERGHLLDRIQHPDRVVTATDREFVIPERREEDVQAERAWERVGHINPADISDDFGIGDDG